MTTFIEKPRFACALGGALATVNALPRSVPILHASLGCGGMTSASFNGASGYLGSGYCGGNSMPVSGITEKEIVFGGVHRLEEQIRNTVDIIDADLFVVVSGCTAEIIGDDIVSTVREYNESRGAAAPVIFTSGAGFKGDSYVGYDSVLQSLITDYVEQTGKKIKGLVNLWGVPPAQDVFWEGNLVELRRILEGLGLAVNSFFTSYDTLEGIRKAGQAELNIVVSPIHGVAAAETFQEIHGIPYLSTPLPIGVKSTERFIRTVTARLSVDKDTIEKFLKAQSQRNYRYFNRVVDAYSDIDLQRYTVIIGDANYAPALTAFVSQELGWLPLLVVVTDQIQEEKREGFLENFSGVLESADRTVVFETDASQVADHLFDRWPRPDGTRYYRALSPAFVLGSRLDKDFADGIGAGHLSVSYPVSNRVVLNRGYAGYYGALNLTEDIFSSILQAR